MTTTHTDPLAVRLARAIALYRAGELVVAAILAKCEVGRQQFYDALHRHGIALRGYRWQVRLPLVEPSAAALRDEEPPPPPLPPRDDGPADRPSLGDRMARLVAQNMTVLEGSLTAAHGVDPERIGRALTAQARMVAGLEKLNRGREDDTVAEPADPQPRTLAELRDELRRHLQRIQDEGRIGGLSADADAGRDGAAAGALADPLPAGPAPAG